MNEPDPYLVLARISARLRRMSVPYAVVGGIAVSVRAEPRVTRDVDLAVAVDDHTLQRVVFELRDEYSIFAPFDSRVGDRLATVRLLEPRGMLVDLIAASAGIEPEVVESASPIALEGLGEVPIASAEALLAMKVLSWEPRRPQDLVDAHALIRVNQRMNLSRVRELLALIQARGFDRGKDLPGILDRILRDVGG